jgi:hypothetical protein
MLYLQRDFYNLIFKMKHKLYIATVPPPPPRQGKILSAHVYKAFVR